MNFLQKILQGFVRSESKQDKLLLEIEKLSAKKTIASKQNGYKSRVFYADKHIKDWKNAISEAVAPPFYRKQDIYELIEQVCFDAQIHAQLQTRKNGTLSERFILENTSNPDAAVKQLIKKIINVILDSLFYWASACEFSENIVQAIEPVYLCPEKQELVVGHDKGIPFELFEDLLVFENPYKNVGLLAFASQYAIYKRFSLSDWSRHSELFGMPFLSLNTPVTDPEEIKKRHYALASFGSNAYVILDTDEELKAIDTKSTANPHQIYKEMITFCDEQISKIIVGQVATADQKAFVGSAEVQERILDWYIEADMLYVLEQINGKVLPLLAKKGLVAENTVFAWEYFKRKQETGRKKQEEDFHHHHIETDYESYLLSLKKKS